MLIQIRMNSQISDPETGQFVPYDANYIARQQAQRRSAYEETYYIPAGKVVEFRDENDHVIYRHVSSIPVTTLLHSPNYYFPSRARRAWNNSYHYIED